MRISWDLMGFNGDLMGFNGDFIGFHRIQWGCNGFVCNLMQCLWDVNGFNVICPTKYEDIILSSGWERFCDDCTKHPTVFTPRCRRRAEKSSG